MDERDSRGSRSDIGQPSPDIREVRVFLCYRRQDGAWHADWLHRHLNDASFQDTNGKACRVSLYYDKLAPGVSDWKQHHFPSLQVSQAMILVCTPGIATDFSKLGQPDWVYEELRWWSRFRNIAPIVVDATGEGERWLPGLIRRKWPNINRIDVNREDAEAAEDTDLSFAARIRTRIIDTIRVSEQSALFEDLQRLRRLSKRLMIALSSSVLLFLLAAAAAVVAFKALDAEEKQRHIAEEQTRIAQEQMRIAEKQTRIAEEQKHVVQQQVIKLLFLPDLKDSDDARDAFYTSLGGSASSGILLTLIDRTIRNKSSRHGMINGLRILECYGPYRGVAFRRAFDIMLSKLESTGDQEVKSHLKMIRLIVEADQSGKPRPKVPGYDRCQWLTDAAQHAVGADR